MGCGCAVTMASTGPVTYVARIDRCELHDAARDMLNALKSVRDSHLKGHSPGQSLVDLVVAAIVHAERPMPARQP